MSNVEGNSTWSRDVGVPTTFVEISTLSPARFRPYLFNDTSYVIWDSTRLFREIHAHHPLTDPFNPPSPAQHRSYQRPQQQDRQLGSRDRARDIHISSPKYFSHYTNFFYSTCTIRQPAPTRRDGARKGAQDAYAPDTYFKFNFFSTTQRRRNLDDEGWNKLPAPQRLHPRSRSRNSSPPSAVLVLLISVL